MLGSKIRPTIQSRTATTPKPRLLRNPVKYIDSDNPLANRDFASAFYQVLAEHYDAKRQLVVLCIGTDRVTGDSLGPIIGYKLAQYIPDHVQVYGTLEEPVHAKNLESTLGRIKRRYANPFIIAIDASLGRMESIGCLTVGAGSIKPGQGVDKILPEVGDMFITGIVNYNGMFGNVAIQNTRLNVVMKMADIAHYGILSGFSRLAA